MRRWQSLDAARGAHNRRACPGQGNARRVCASGASAGGRRAHGCLPTSALSTHTPSLPEHTCRRVARTWFCAPRPRRCLAGRCGARRARAAARASPAAALPPSAQEGGGGGAAMEKALPARRVRRRARGGRAGRASDAACAESRRSRVPGPGAVFFLIGLRQPGGHAVAPARDIIPPEGQKPPRDVFPGPKNASQRPLNRLPMCLLLPALECRVLNSATTEPYEGSTNHFVASICRAALKSACGCFVGGSHTRGRGAGPVPLVQGRGSPESCWGVGHSQQEKKKEKKAPYYTRPGAPAPAAGHGAANAPLAALASCQGPGSVGRPGARPPGRPWPARGRAAGWQSRRRLNDHLCARRASRRQAGVWRKGAAAGGGEGGR